MPDEPNKPFGIASSIAELSRADAGYVILAVALTDQKLETLILAYMPKSFRRKRQNALFVSRATRSPCAQDGLCLRAGTD